VDERIRSETRCLRAALPVRGERLVLHPAEFALGKGRSDHGLRPESKRIGEDILERYDVDEGVVE
jgi:hypothetical protein